MFSLEICPDCSGRRPASSPAGLCPRCLLRVGIALAVDPEAGLGNPGTNRDHDDLDAELGPVEPPIGVLNEDRAIAAIPRVHLRDTSEDTRLIRPRSSETSQLSGQPARYQLIGELARGGMGVIFQGRDLELGRDLAVKVIREEHRDHPEMVRRFVEEAQIGGQLQHPGIVPVHELGRLPDGRLFIAMKLVRGRTLAALLATRRGPDEDRIRFLSVFEQVCQTMAYAHARGVIHRDLKPSNIMVGSFGEVQVMDWGLAKVLDQGGVADEEKAILAGGDDPAVWTLRSGSAAMESRPGSVLGTPSYMAPEQARGSLDTLDERADVFALGSILCEILTGRPAFADEAGAELYRRAERADLSDAMARLDACDADPELTALARSCLAAAAKHRPRDAGVVVAELTAYLRGVEGRLREAELAQARAEAQAAGERRRRLLTLALAASMVGTLLFGVTGWGWMDRERRRREGNLRAAVDGALAEASKKRESARASGGDPIPWVEAIEAARRAESVLGDNPGKGLRARVHAYLAELVRERDAAADAEKDRRIVERLAAVLNDLGVHNDDAKADADFASAFRAYGVDLDRSDPASAVKVLAASPAAADLASALDQWAFLRRGQVLRNPAGARRLIAAARAADPDPWRNGLRDTLERTNGGPAQRLETLERLAAIADIDRLPVASVTRLATSLAFLGRRDQSISLLRRAQASHRDDFWVNADLGRDLMFSGRPDEAVRFFAVAASVRPKSGIALDGLGKSLLLSGQPTEAADVFRELNRLRPEDALAHVALGSARLALGEPHEAAAQFGEAKRIKPDDWMVRDQIAITYSDRGDWLAAIQEQREAVRKFPRFAVAHKALAHALQSAGRLDEAVAEFREAVRLDPRLSSANLFLGRALIETGDYREALAVLARVDPGPPPADPYLTPADLSSSARDLMSLEGRLPAVLAGVELPSDAEEGVSFARIAFARHQTLGAARLWADSFASSPALADDLASANRFQAARAAALAASEPGSEESPSEPGSRARWVKQALDWLDADLRASEAVLRTGNSRHRAAVLKRLGRWQVDPVLAGIREESALAEIPEPERRTLREFWRCVGALRVEAKDPAVPNSDSFKKN
ncbi:serine/threonine-protein kinase [Singulisphaera sp. GP187]|uniref:serine/threonine-protein kinase n=1 Tax=Singulisphaera sp. GP187 TaxID=1882752 RepID=UPI001356307C|nr:serine/threonine-protein kinase [Singulisphaera sp. GP187]